MLDVLGHDLRAPRRLSLRGRKWKYRGEGNANLVLALTQERKIVRLRKNENGCIMHIGEEEEQERVMLETVFCRRIMVPLLGEVYIQPPSAAYMEEEEVHRLDHILRAQRPAHRHHKGLRFSHVTVYPDYALLPLHLSPTNMECDVAFPTFCVEVKPKQGWIPGPDRRLPKCTFCLNQYLKLKNGTVKTRSQYCPLDLFSGIHTRMKCALQNLLLHPQNNLKIFQDGVLVYGDDMGECLEVVLERWLGNSGHGDTHRLVEKFCDLVYKALTCNLCTESVCSSVVWNGLNVPTHCTVQGQKILERLPAPLVTTVNSLLPGPPCDWSAEPLPQDCILERILRIQKLEQNGADLIYNMYHSGQFSPISSDYSYITPLLKMSHITAIHKYLLATTAKDCSIMIAFQRINVPAHKHSRQISENHIIKDCDAQSYVFNIGVSDLDPKPLPCIEKHRKRDCEILSACLEMLGSSEASMY